MSKRNLHPINLNEVGWSFEEVCEVAKEIKPDNWCIVESSERIAFIEIKLPRKGPALLQKQVILSNYLQVDIFVGSRKLSNILLSTEDITSVVTLENHLKTLESLSSCLGNRNFHRINRFGAKEYWRHSQCLLLYNKDTGRQERCCDNCLELNSFLPKRKDLVIPAADEDDEGDCKIIYSEVKRIKKEPTE